MNIMRSKASRVELVTGTSGDARFNDVSEGLYEVVLKSDGYDTVRIPSVRIIRDKVTPLSVDLRVSSSELEQVLVVGSTQASMGIDAASASQLDREALRSAAGSGSDVLRALDGLPGLFSDGEFSSFTVRGNSPRNNLILVDGVPFDRVVHFSDSFGELDEVESGGRYSVFAPNIVGKAEFKPGGWDAAYGGRAGSLLKLEVAEANPETASYTARLDIAGLEIGYDGPSQIHDDTSVLFSARQLNFGRLFELIGADDFGEPELTDVIFKSSTDLGDGDSLSVLLIHAPEKYQRDAEHALASDEDNPGVWEDLELVEFETDNSLLAATWSTLVGDSGEVVNKVYVKDFSEASQSGELLADQVPLNTPASEVPSRFPIVTSQNDEREYGWRFDYALDNRIGRLSAGFRATYLDLYLSRALSGDWIRYEYESDDFRPNSDQRFIVLTPEAVDTEFETSGHQYTLYFDQQASLGDIDLRFGLRYENDGLIDDNAFSPRFGASWQLNNKLNATLTAGRYLQTPRFSDIAADATNELSFEKTDQLSLGFKYRYSDDIELFIEPYYQDISDRVVELDGVNQTFANSGEGRVFGFDSAITKYFGNGWSASANYSYNDARVKDSENGLEYDADYSRPHSATIGGIWEINERWKISARAKYASGRPFDDSIVHENVLGDGELRRFSKEFVTNNTERYDGFFSINTRIDYRRSFGGTSVIAFLDIINLTGNENPSNDEFNERSGLDEVEDGETFPLFGMRFEW